jgi:hypothetical protein
VSSSQRSKEWRAKKQAEDPAYMDRQRALARERANARHQAMKDDPDYVERERVRKRELQARRRADPVKKAKISEDKKRYLQDEGVAARQKQATKKWKTENRDKLAEYKQAWNAENRDKVSAYNVAYMSDYMKTEVYTQSKHRSRMKRYQITDADFNAMWENQNGCCAICKVKLQPRGRSKHSAAIDHNHKTSVVRGVLCRGCNHGIGSLGDSPSILIAAAKYLEERGYYGQPEKSE